jgi:uncharacterized coiled-coil DUF342 family protein
MDKKRKAYQEKKEAQLREWAAKVDALRARADQVKAEAKIQYYEQIEGVQTRLRTAQHRLRELQQAGDEAWDTLKDGVEDAWTDLREHVETAVSRFKSSGGESG